MRTILHCITSAAILAASPANAAASVRPTPVGIHNGIAKPELAREINALFTEDQAFIAQTGAAKSDKAFAMAFGYYAHRATDRNHLLNFYDPYVYALWDKDPDAPELVHRAAASRRKLDSRVQTIIAENGWPRRRDVGDVAAASFFFLFGHADDINDWRTAQVPEIERVFQEDQINPQLYAHILDRLLCVSGKPQVYGSIMGPGNSPGSARFYWPLINDDIAAADERRASIGLPSIEANLQKFRSGAEISAYMAPLTRQQQADWTLADVYQKSVR